MLQLSDAQQRNLDANGDYDPIVSFFSDAGDVRQYRLSQVVSFYTQDFSGELIGSMGADGAYMVTVSIQNGSDIFEYFYFLDSQDEDSMTSEYLYSLNDGYDFPSVSQD